MRQLLDDLLDLSRSDSGRLVIDNEPVQLSSQLECFEGIFCSIITCPPVCNCQRQM